MTAAPAPRRRPVSARTYTPTLDRLPLEARSVRVPALVSIGLVLLAVAAAVAWLVLASLAISGAAVLSDVDQLDRSLTPRQILRCEDRLDELADARRDHIDRTGEVPTDIDQVAPGATDVVLGPDGTAVPAPGSRCEGVADGEVSADQALRDRRDVAWVAIAGIGSVGALVAAGAVGLAAPVVLSWWLASAYRCLPRTTRHRSPRAAYALVRAVGVLAPLWLAYVVLGRSYLVEDHGGVLVLLYLVLALVTTVATIRAVLLLVSMIGDVTFEFCHRHYGTARAMRMSVWASFLLPCAFAAAAVGASAAGDGVVGQGLAVVAWILLAALWANPLVFAVSLAISVAMATAGIDRTLRTAADEANRAEADERARQAHEAHEPLLPV